jgi:hypothetical protein
MAKLLRSGVICLHITNIRLRQKNPRPLFFAPVPIIETIARCANCSEVTLENLNVEFHVSVLTVPGFITSEKFPSWLLHEAAAIQALSEKNSLTIVRLYLASRIKEDISRKKLDELLQSIADKYPAIFRVEMKVIEDGLDYDEIEQIESEVEGELAELLKSIEQFQQQKDAKGRLH